MFVFVIWVDRENAKLFKLTEDSLEMTKLHSGYTDHHTHRRDGDDAHRTERQLFLKVVESLGHTDIHQILILGPGLAKHQFRTFLSEHHPFLARKVVGCESSDHPTDAQIASLGRKYFKSAVLSET